MSRTISYLFTEAVNEAPEGSPENLFVKNIEHHYKKFYRSNNCVLYTTLSAGFLVSVMGIIQASLTHIAESGENNISTNVINTLQVLTPTITAFIAALAKARANKAASELNRLIDYGIGNRFFRSDSGVNAYDPENPEDQNEFNPNAIKYQMGMTT